MSPLLQVPRALTQGGDRPGGGHPRRIKDGDGRTSVHNALAGIRTATQLAQGRRLSPEPQVPRALTWRGRDGSPQVPWALTRGAAPSRPECRITGSTPQRQGTRPQEAADSTSCAQHHQAGPGGFLQELGWAE